MGHVPANEDKGPPAVVKPVRTIVKVDLATVAGTPADAKAARGMPGFQEAAKLLAAALTAEAACIFLDFCGQACEVHWRTAAGWQAREPLPRESVLPLLAVMKAVSKPLSDAGQELSTGEFIVSEKCRWRCRVTVRKADKSEQWLLQIRDDSPASTGLVQRLGGMVSGFLPSSRRQAGVEHITASGPAQLRVKLQPLGKPDIAAEDQGLEPAAALVGQALAVRACCMRLESAGGPVTVHVDVDGVWRPFDPLDTPVGTAVLTAFKTLAGVSESAARPLQTGKCSVVVEGKVWPCSVVAIRVKGRERVEVQFGYGRPVFKTLSDLGMPEGVRQQLQELVAMTQGVFVVVAPRRNGLSTLFEHVMLATDRLMRDFISIEDIAARAREVQNVKSVCWDTHAKIMPVDALEKALREYPQGLVACDLTDAALAQKLVGLSERGQLVVLGINSSDVAGGIGVLLGLGVPAEQLGRVLLGGVGGRLVRKLCPKCREEYLPPINELGTLRLDPSFATTLWRASTDGCEVCGGSGYLGRTGIFEIAAGRTLQHYVAKAADASTLRKAAAKDGMVPLNVAAVELVKSGVTSLDEVRRVLASASTKPTQSKPPTG